MITSALETNRIDVITTILTVLPRLLPHIDPPTTRSAVVPRLQVQTKSTFFTRSKSVVLTKLYL
jgi:hypothetical protein